MAGNLINPALDTGALRQAFQRDGKVQIKDVLRPDFAEAIYQCLLNDVPWELAVYRAGKSGKAAFARYSAEEVAAMGEEGYSRLEDEARASASHQFQYLYDAYDVLKARRESRHPELLLQEFLTFMGSDELFDFAREVSGDLEFNRIDCHACRYRQGQFLREHGDHSPFENRHMAYVFYFTPDWHADYGGVTYFLDQDGGVLEALIPQFNSLTLFRVPVAHSVSQVASFAPKPRLSITGWFTRYD